MTSTTVPKILFWGTLVAVIAIAVLSFFYIRAVNQIEADSQKIAQIKADYEKRVQDLKSKLVVEQTKTVKVPSQVVSQNCTSIGPFHTNVCLPQVKTVEQEVQQVVKVEDPKVRAELDDALAHLKDLSNQNQNAKSLLEDLRPWYEFAQQLMKPLISIIVLIVSLVIILSKRYNADQEKWAFGSLGTIIGVWLK
jgi:hypothetical protein